MGYLPFLATRLMILIILFMLLCLFMRQINVLSLSVFFQHISLNTSNQDRGEKDDAYDINCADWHVEQ